MEASPTLGVCAGQRLVRPVGASSDRRKADVIRSPLRFRQAVRFWWSRDALASRLCPTPTSLSSATDPSPAERSRPASCPCADRPRSARQRSVALCRDLDVRGVNGASAQRSLCAQRDAPCRTRGAHERNAPERQRPVIAATRNASPVTATDRNQDPPTAPSGTEGKLTQLRCHGTALALSMTTGEPVPLQACAWCCLASS